MAFKVFGKQETKTEPPVQLTLVEEDGDICLAAVDEGGVIIPAGYILGIHPDGTLHRYAGSRVPGIKLDEDDVIVVSK